MHMFSSLLQVVIVLHVLLWIFDGFGLLATIVGIATHAVYHALLKGFPFIEFTSPLFLLSCCTPQHHALPMNDSIFLSDASFCCSGSIDVGLQ